MIKYLVNNKPVYNYGRIIDSRTNSVVYISIYGFDDNIKSLLSFFNGKRKIPIDKNLKFLTSNTYNCITEHIDEDTMHVIFYLKEPYQRSNIDSSNTFYIYLNKQDLDNECVNSLNLDSMLNNKKISEVIYNQLYEKFKKNITIPILREWIPYIIIKFPYHYNNYEANGFSTCHIKKMNSYESNIIALRVNIDGDDIVNIISEGLKDHSINLGDKPVRTDIDENDVKTLDEYLGKYSSQLMNRVQNAFTPVFNSKTESFDSKVESFSNYVSYRSNKKLFNAQKSVINATARNIRKNRSTIIVGQMGSGI